MGFLGMFCCSLVPFAVVWDGEYTSLEAEYCLMIIEDCWGQIGAFFWAFFSTISGVICRAAARSESSMRFPDSALSLFVFWCWRLYFLFNTLLNVSSTYVCVSAQPKWITSLFFCCLFPKQWHITFRGLLFLL